MKHHVIEGKSPTDVADKFNKWAAKNGYNKDIKNLLNSAEVQSDGNGLYWVSFWPLNNTTK